MSFLLELIVVEMGLFTLKATALFLTCTEITENNWYCLNFKNVKNCKEKFQRVKSFKEFKF